jgi:hypothetical protein
MKTIKIIVFFAAALALPLPCLGNADFLLLEPSARALGQGGAYAADGGSVASMRYNPAGLASVPGYDLAVSHESAFGEWSHEWVGAAMHLDDTAYAAEFISSSMESFALYDENGNNLGTASAGDQTLGLAVATTCLGVQAGGSLHGFRSQLLGFSNSGWSVDMGLRYQLSGTNLSVALVGQNFGEETSYDAGNESLPALFRAGLDWRTCCNASAKLDLSAESVRFLSTQYQNQFRAGAQLGLFNVLNLALGLQQSSAQTQPTLGLGATLGRYEVSYAYLPGNLLGSTQLLSLEIAI